MQSFRKYQVEGTGGGDDHFDTKADSSTDEEDLQMQKKLRAQALHDLVQKFNPSVHREDTAILYEITGFQEGLARRAAGLKASVSADAGTNRGRPDDMEQPNLGEAREG